MGSMQMIHKASEADAEGLSTLPGCQQRKSTCSDIKSLELIWICLEHSVEESLPEDKLEIPNLAQPSWWT